MKDGMEIAALGRIGKAPTMKAVGEQGTSCLSFSMAVDQGTDEPEWIGVACWGDVAENLRDCLKPGDSIYCEGKARVQRWKPEDGPERAMLKVNARLCQPLGKIGRRASNPPRDANSPGRPPAKRSGPSRSTVDSQGYDRGKPF